MINHRCNGMKENNNVTEWETFQVDYIQTQIEFLASNSHIQHHTVDVIQPKISEWHVWSGYRFKFWRCQTAARIKLERIEKNIFPFIMELKTKYRRINRRSFWMTLKHCAHVFITCARFPTHSDGLSFTLSSIMWFMFFRVSWNI